MKKMVMFLLMLITITLISGCDVRDEEISGDYVYQWRQGDYVITKLSEQGKEKEILVIPTEYKGFPLLFYKAIPGNMFDSTGLGSNNAKKVFVSDYYNSWREDYLTFRNAKIFVITTEVTNRVSSGSKYMPYILYNEQQYGNPANISYYYNYENSPNRGYYWIDDYNYGEKIIFIPENPFREGYIFGGWYKESECTNRWEYERDTLSEEVIDEEGITIYQETKLYAKWIKRQY